MAEWAPPTPPPPPPPGQPLPPAPNNAAAPAAEPDLHLGAGTYVVQVPKDQIYRVPPPGNARIVEQYHNNLLNQRRRQRPCVSVLLWLVAAALLAAVLLLILALVFFLVIRHGAPSFTVERFVVKDRHPSKPEYDVTLKSLNPNAQMAFTGESGGKSVLSHRNRDIAAGETPGFSLGFRSATVFELVLHGLDNGLPKEMESSSKGSKGIVVPLALSIEFPVRLRVGGMRVWDIRMEVECDVRMSGLAKGVRVVSQECNAKLR